MPLNKCYTCGCDLNVFSESKGHKGECRACYAAYRRHRYKNPLDKKNAIARTKANRKHKAGILLKQPCVFCGDENTQMHHPDYNKPYDVSWMCKRCHEDFHSFERKILKSA